MLRPSDALMIPFSLLWGGFAFFWEFTAVRSGAPLFAQLWGIPFVLIGLYITVGRFIVDAMRRARTYYAVTDKRAMILSIWFTRNVRSITSKALSDINLNLKRDGRGTIAFSSGGALGGGPWLWTDGSNSRKYELPAFELIEDARRVYELLQRVQDGSIP